MDRRTTIKWMLAASAAWSFPEARGAQARSAISARGYGTDPDLLKVYRRGELWPLTLSVPQRRLAGILADIIIPADAHSPSASAVGVVEFIDEWISAPYPAHLQDRTILLDGFAWLDAESARRSGKGFSDLDDSGRLGICEVICNESHAAAAHRGAARFFAVYRDLTAGGFYSTPVGRKDLNYIGNVPLARFDGPPPALLKSLGLQ
jgi:hypothetical protein